MKYLVYGERPAIEPHRNEAISWFYKGCSFYQDYETGEVIVTDFGEDKRPEDWKKPTEEDIDAVYAEMIYEWENEWPIVSHNQSFLTLKSNNILLKLFNDMESGIVPGKNGEFYSYLKENLK